MPYTPRDAARAFRTGPRSARLGTVALVGVFAAVAFGGAVGAVPAAAPMQADFGTYRLVDTWTEAPWTLTAGRFGMVGDVTSAPDGTLFVLDTAHEAIHVLSAGGVPRITFPVPAAEAPPSACSASRIDAMPDGRVAVLGSCTGEPPGGDEAFDFVMQLDAQGTVTSVARVAPGYADVAAGPEGLLYLARLQPVVRPTPEPRADPVRLPGGIDIVDPRAGPTPPILGRIEHPALFYPVSLDVDADGTIYVANRVPSPWDYEQPVPRPTPPPAFASSQEDPEVVEGVAVFAPDRTYRETVRFTTPEDVAAGPAGAFVSRNVEVFRVGDSSPLYAAPAGSLNVGFSDRFLVHLDVPRRGGLHAGYAHCFFQGVLTFPDPRPPVVVPRLSGALDRPDLEGPIHPSRMDVGDRLALLQDRFRYAGQRPNRTYSAGPEAHEPQSVQRWTLAGRLDDQLGICSGSMSLWMSDRGSAYWASDVAVDGDVVYTVDRDLLRRRSSHGFPEWSYWPGSVLPPDARAHLAAVSAGDGRVAILDAGTDAVTLVREDGSSAARWTLESAAADAMPTDLALGERALFVADTGRNRVRRYGLDGALQAMWPTRDGPWRIDAGPGDDVYALGRGGWAMRYDADGRLLAAWPPPDPAAQVVDIAAGKDGRVYVAFVRRRATEAEGIGGTVYALDGAGVWVFEPGPRVEAPAPEPEACWAVTDKTAQPGNVRLGEQVEVDLRIDGACPGTTARAQVVVLLDTSRSMNWNEAADRARQVSLAVVQALDPRAVDVALVTFDDAAALQVPLTSGHAAIASRVVALEAWGDTRLAAGLEAAVAELSGERAAPGARRMIVVVTDGEYTDDARPVAEAARADGVEIMAVALPHGGLSSFLDGLVMVTGARWRILVDPEPEAAAALARSLGGYEPESGLFETVEIVDRLPANMRFVAGSAEPPARLEGDTLRWSVSDVAASSGLRLRYRVEPQQIGTWPTNVAATASYVDALGDPGTLGFPVPHVYVWDLSNLTQKAYLPYVARSACFRSNQAIDVVLAIDASESMDGPAVGGGSKLEAARAAAGGFVDLLRLPGDRAAVVAFNDEARVLVDLTGDRGQVGAALARIASAPGTRLDRALDAAGGVIERSGRSDAQPVLILLSDGLHAGSAEDVTARAETLRARGVLIFAIGLGADADDALLLAVAGAAESYLHSPTEAELDEVFRRLLASLACLVG